MHSSEYCDAVCRQLDSQRHVLYGHLCDVRYKQLRDCVRAYAHCFYIDGAPPSTLKGYEFDLVLKDGSVPVKHKLPKYSEAQRIKESHHIKKAESLAHLKTPTSKEMSEWGTRTHIVWKYDDEYGRWICDF
jgi:hypothetical protein